MARESPWTTVLAVSSRVTVCKSFSSSMPLSMRFQRQVMMFPAAVCEGGPCAVIEETKNYTLTSGITSEPSLGSIAITVEPGKARYAPILFQLIVN